MTRQARQEDIDSVVAIYNQAVTARFQTACTEEQSVAERSEWFSQHMDPAYPLIVYTEDEKVAGWFSISPYRSGRAALRYTVEISCFIHTDYQGKGIGQQLLRAGLDACRRLQYKTVISIILDKNVASIRLMEKSGFEQWACLPGVADFDGVECGHLYYGFRL